MLKLAFPGSDDAYIISVLLLPVVVFQLLEASSAKEDLGKIRTYFNNYQRMGTFWLEKMTIELNLLILN